MSENEMNAMSNVIKFPKKVSTTIQGTVGNTLPQALRYLDVAVAENEREKAKQRAPRIVVNNVINDDNLNSAGVVSINHIPANDLNSSVNERLSIALVKLMEANEIQKEAVAKWRESLAELKNSVGNLGKSFQTLNENLENLNKGVSKIKEESIKTVEIIEKSGF